MKEFCVLFELPEAEAAVVARFLEKYGQDEAVKLSAIPGKQMTFQLFCNRREAGSVGE